MGSVRLSGWNRVKAGAALTLASALVGGLVMVVSRQVLAQDPAARLASTLGLGSGMVLGVLVGGPFGLWLVLGGAKRIAGTAGFFFGIVVILAVWRVASPYFWVMDVVMNEVFGEGDEQHSGLAAFLLAIPIFRGAAGATASLTMGLIKIRQR